MELFVDRYFYYGRNANSTTIPNGKRGTHNISTHTLGVTGLNFLTTS